MPFAIAMLLLLLVFGGVGYYLYTVVVGSKQKWNQGVAGPARQAGMQIVPGAHGFAKIESPRPNGTAMAFVFNGVASEKSVAQHLRKYNTNGWLTLITKAFPSGSGPSFAVEQGKPGRSSVSLSDPAFDARHGVTAFGDPASLPSLWTPKARELMARSGAQFEVVSGGERITIVARGVVDQPALVADMLELAHELAR